MAAETPSTGNVEIKLDDALKNPALKEQKEMYPWRKDYENLDYNSDNFDPVEISKEKPTLSHVLLPALESSNPNDKALARKKFRAICALLVQAHFNPDSVQVGYKISLKDNVLYIERPKSKKAPKVALKLKNDATVEGGNKELKKGDEKVVERSQINWKNLGDAISKGIAYDVIVAMYKTKDSKSNFAKRGEIWEKEMGKTEFKGSAAQNKEILGFLKKKLEEVTAPAPAPAEPAPAPAPAPAEPAPAPAPAPAEPAPAAPAEPAPAPAEPAPAPAPAEPAPAPAPAEPAPAPAPAEPAPAPAPAEPAPAPAPAEPAPAPAPAAPPSEPPAPAAPAPAAPDAPKASA